MAMDLKALHDQIHAQINDIDSKLDLLVDPATATKRKLTNDLIAAHKGNVLVQTTVDPVTNEKIPVLDADGNPTPLLDSEGHEQIVGGWFGIANQLKEKFSDLSVDVQIGVFYGLIRELDSLRDPLSKELDKMVSEAPAPDTSEKPTPEQAKQLATIRSDFYGKLKNLIETAKSFGQDEGMVMAKKRTGGRGKRGVRKSTYISWELDAQPIEKLSDIVELYPQFEKRSDLTKAMKVAGINLTEPPEKIEFALPDGKLLVGIYSPPSGSTGADVDDDEDDDDEDDETEEVTAVAS